MIRLIIGGVIVLLIGALSFHAVDHAKKHDSYKPSYNFEETYDHDHDEVVILHSAFMVLADNVELQPFSHASALLRWDDMLIFIDPVGDATSYANYGVPDVVLVTHRHSDHMDTANLPGMLGENTVVLAPQDVINQLPVDVVAVVTPVAPGKTQIIDGLTFEAIAAYNLRPEAQRFHSRSRGDVGFVISDDTTRMYISGDTEGTPEMKSLQNIDVALIAMNLPYTMSVEDAAEAVLSFSPKVVFPYHYRTPDGFSDVELFRTLVNKQNPEINVQLIDWYSETE